MNTPIRKETHSFRFKKTAFPHHLLTFTLAMKTAKRSICRHNSMARHTWRKWIDAQRLTNRLRRATSDSPPQCSVGNDLPGRHLEQCRIYSVLEIRHFHSTEKIAAAGRSIIHPLHQPLDAI